MAANANRSTAKKQRAMTDLLTFSPKPVSPKPVCRGLSPQDAVDLRLFRCIPCRVRFAKIFLLSHLARGSAQHGWVGSRSAEQREGRWTESGTRVEFALAAEERIAPAGCANNREPRPLHAT